MKWGLALALALVAGSAHAQTSTAQAIKSTAATPQQNRSNASATGTGAPAVLVQGSSSQSDICLAVSSAAFGNTALGVALNLQKADGNCVRLRKVHAWLDIAVVSGDRRYATVAAELLRQDADSAKAYDQVFGK